MVCSFIDSKLYIADSFLGDVVYVNLIGQPVVFLGSYKAAIDLLEHRGTIYSSRKQSVMGTKMCVLWVILRV
jgi:hypothetical protein